MVFLALYLLSALVVGSLALLWQRHARAGQADERKPGPLDLAYLHGGPELAVHACAGFLRRAKAVELGRVSTLVSVGEVPPGAPPLAAAIHRALRQAKAWTAVLRDVDVATELHRIAARARRRGWVLEPGQIRKAKLSAFPIFAIALVGIARLVYDAEGWADPGGSFVVAGQVVASVGLLFFGWQLTEVPPLSRQGEAHLDQARAEHTALRPEQAAGYTPAGRLSRKEAFTPPAWNTRSPADLVIAIALYGTSALASMDPAFARAIQIGQTAPPPLRRSPAQTPAVRQNDSSG